MPQLYAYFKKLPHFMRIPFFMQHIKLVEFYIEFENVIPLEVYEQIITKLQLALHVHVKLHIHSKNNAVEMDELDRYVNQFCGKNIVM